MADILDRLEKLESLVRHDDEARTICADARAEIVKLRGTGNAGAAANAAAHSWYRSSLAAPMPPSRNTQVKLDVVDDNIQPSFASREAVVRWFYEALKVPTRGV